jgi:tRNA (guanosine-2'-O-)-methyltransferase
MSRELINYLKAFISDERFALFEKVINSRTRYITLVLEDIYQSQNASAVLRSCDSFGIQDVHIIENRNIYQTDTEVSLGSEKWLNFHKFNCFENNSLEAIKKLKKENYRIIATSPHVNGQSLYNLNLNNGKMAIFLGTELKGLSNTVMENADEFMNIPMVGFAESFNISVAAALIMQTLTVSLHKSDIIWQLSEIEKDELMLSWLRKSIKKVNLIEQRMNEK